MLDLVFFIKLLSGILLLVYRQYWITYKELFILSFPITLFNLPHWPDPLTRPH